MPQITTDSFRQQLCAVFTEYPWLAIQQSLQEEVRKGWRELNSLPSHFHRPGILWMAGKLRPGKCSHFWLYDDYGNLDIFFSHHILNSEVSDFTAPLSPRKTGSHREEENGSNRCTTVWLNLTYCKFGLLLKNQQTLVTLLCSDLVGPSQASPWP